MEIAPLQKIPNRMISCMVENAVFWINTLPVNSGMSCMISPQLHAVPHITRYLPRTNRKPPRFLLVRQLPYWKPYETTYLYSSPRTNTHFIDRVHALADADDQNPAFDFFDRLGNPIPYGNTPDDNNEDDAGDIAGVEEYDNQTDIPGVVTPD